MAKLGLGTVQFGLDYGVSNSAGQTAKAQALQILDVARHGGVEVLDTAAAYGDSEAVLGDLLDDPQSWKLVTKIAPLPATADRTELLRDARESFDRSLRRLQVDSVYGLMVHRADNLLQPAGEAIWEWMAQLRNRGSLEKIGASVYHPAQARALLERFDIDIVQLPLSVFDQRFAKSGALAELHAAGVEVHARSVFLQGLLLMTPEKLDDFFAPIRGHVRRFHSALEDQGIGAVEAALGYALTRDELDVVVIGVNTAEQLQANLRASQVSCPDEAFWSEFALEDETWTVPSNWQLAAD